MTDDEHIGFFGIELAPGLVGKFDKGQRLLRMTFKGEVVDHSDLLVRHKGQEGIHLLRRRLWRMRYCPSVRL